MSSGEKPRKNQFKIYPKYSLDTAIKFAKEIVHDIGGPEGIAPIEKMLKKMDLQSERSGRYAYQKSSAQQFGLIRRRNEGLQMTEFGNLCISESITQKDKFQALIKSPLFKEMILELKNDKLPNDSALKKKFKEFGLDSAEAQKSILKSFRHSINYVGLLKQDLTVSIPKDFLELIEEDSEQKSENEIDLDDNTTDEDKEARPHKLEIQLSTGKKATICIPRNTSDPDKEQIIDIIKSLK